MVRLDAAAGDLAQTEAVAAQVPAPSSFERRTLVVLLAEASPAGGAWRRLVFLGDAPVSRAARASALLMRGYVGIGASVDGASSQDLVWAWSHPAP